jgi:putative acetyltransferase
MVIRKEIAEDIPAIFKINEAAFGRPEEALLVDRLRAKKGILFSLVAVHENRLVGHALFSPVLIQGENGVVIVVAGLGPIAVLPDTQDQGIGGALIKKGIDLCREVRYRAVIVLGHPSYYPRFGFQAAAQFGINCAYDVPDDAFMVLPLEKSALEGISGVAYYHPEFDDV